MRRNSPLREAVANHYHKKYNVSVSPEQVIVTMRTSPALLLTLCSLVNAGDEVILSDPTYACYPNFIRYIDGEPVFVPVYADEGFVVDPSKIKEKIGPKTKVIIINSPSNPTGWRLGYIIAPKEFVRPIQKSQQNLFISPNTISQWAGVTALTEDIPEIRQMVETYDARRRFIVDNLRGLGFGIKKEPHGAFYVLADARNFSNDSYKLAFDILEKAKVAVTPGIDFGSNAEGFLRFSYANSIENIKEGCERLKKYIDS